MLNQLAGIPSVAWGIAVAEKASHERRELTPREEAVLGALLSSPTATDSTRKRELYLLVLADDRFPMRLKREAVKGLAHSSRSRQVVEALVESCAGREADERRLYSALLNFWQRVGQLPNEETLLMLDDEVRNDEAGFWQNFDLVMSGQMPVETPLALEILVAAHGEYSQRFFDDVERYVDADDPLHMSGVFSDELRRYLPVSKFEKGRVREAIAIAKVRRFERQERLDVIRFNIPSAFVRQPVEIRFLLLSFLKNMPEEQRASLISELREFGEGHSDAEVFRHFFTRAALEKAGQALSTLVGLVPDEDRRVYAELQDRVPPSSINEVKRTVERELGKPFDQLFSSWDDEPVASASMGDVYRARLIDGAEVIVKVATPSKQAKIRATIAILYKVAEDFEKNRQRFSTMFDVAGELRSFAKKLEQQLSFVKERRNGYQFQGDYAIPAYIPDISTEHVLIMKPSSGIKLTKIRDVTERKKAATVYARDALRMLFADTTYHADPHPGNMLWDATDGGTLTWLDFGVIEFLQEREARQIMELLVALTLDDVESQVSLLSSMSASTDNEAFGRLRRRLEAGQEGLIGDKLGALLGHAGRERVYMKPAIMRALAFLMTVNGVVRDLNPSHDFAADLLSLNIS